MPELPEVQTIITNLLNQKIVNHKIVGVNFYKTKILKNCSPKQFVNFLKGEKILNIERIGKYIIFKLSNKKQLVVHLRMEGKLFYESNLKKPDLRFLMLSIIFDNKYRLSYYDMRMFGTFNIYKNDEYLLSKEIKKVAIDPLNKECTGKFLEQKCKIINRAIKTVLLDQTIVSGIGNIYVDEILFKSKIHPLTKPKYLKSEQYDLIAKNAKLVLKDAIKHKGTTVASYKFDPNHTGGYQSRLLVHTKAGQLCPICKTIIKKIKVNGRGTYFCPNCQKQVGK
ncbi:MAG: DNA-formamidopyrimidine glycosylase [Mycoplasmoidaceae bacterium]|nr:DNA-formamidopyrimidine glycosylase [Mycoplasmoidaceae bacterium]